MGNVQASSPMDSSINSGPPSEADLKSFMEKKVEFPNNPGTMEEIHRKSQEVSPAVFDGCKFTMNKAIGSKLQASHNISLTNNPQNQGYKCSLTHIGERINPNDITPPGPDDLKSLTMAEIDGQGNLSANFIYGFTKNLKTRVVTQMEYPGKPQMCQVTTNYKMSHSTASATFGNVDPLAGSGLGVFQYLHKVSDKVSLGAELAVQKGKQVPGGKMAIPSLAARYEDDTVTLAATGSLGGGTISYYKKCSENLQLASELEVSPRNGEARGSLGFQADVPKANLALRGKIDSNWIVQSVLEKKLDPLPFTLSMSGQYSLAEDKVKVGLGIMIG